MLVKPAFKPIIKPILLLAVLAAGSLSLTGCASSSAMQQSVTANSTQVQQRIDQLQAQARAQEQAQAQARTLSPQVPWVATQRTPFRAPLRAKFSEQITVNETRAGSAQALMTRISALTGIEFVVDNDVFETRTRTEGGGGGGARPAPPAPGGADSARAPAAPMQVTPGATFRMEAGQTPSLSITYSGTVKGLLDTLAGSIGVNWRYDRVNSRVVIYRFESRTLRIAMVPGAVRSNVALGASAGGAEAGSAVTSELDFWGALRTAVDSKISAQGAYTLNEATGLLTIRDRPDVLERVAAYVDRVNANFARQVSIDVSVFRVSVNDADRQGLNFDLALLNAAGTRGFQVTTPRGDTTGLGSMVLNSPAEALSRWAGSQIFLDMLSQLGQTSVVTSSTLHTINNQPVPLRVVRRLSYLASVARSGTGDDVTATLTPATVEVGFTAQMLPHVQENGRDLVMQIMMTLSSLDRMDTFESAGNSIQLPQISSRDFLQRVWLSSGQSLILVGFEQDEQGINNSGMLGHQTWLMGTNTANRARDRLVIVITPSVRNMVSPS